MKTTTSISIIAIFVFASAILNVLQWQKNCQLERLQTLKDHCPYIEAQFPVDGLTNADLSDILKTLDSTGLLNAHSGKGILSIEVPNDDYVLVEIGFIKGGLDGTGNTFGFIRTPQGWIFDEKTRGYKWESRIASPHR